jgi:signal peptidase I
MSGVIRNGSILFVGILFSTLVGFSCLLFINRHDIIAFITLLVFCVFLFVWWRISRKKFRITGVRLSKLQKIAVVVVGLVFVTCFRALLFQPFNIVYNAMSPTLDNGNVVVVAKYSYGYSRFSLPFSPPLFHDRIFFSPPKRGDIAVFKLPRDNWSDQVSRVIGLPGETIQLKEGRLYINGSIVSREPIDPANTTGSLGGVPQGLTYEEILPGGISHKVIDTNDGNGHYENTGVYVVPPDNYFVMGDNRINSTDSRMPVSIGGGYVPLENLVGRVEFIFRPTAGEKSNSVPTRQAITETYASLHQPAGAVGPPAGASGQSMSSWTRDVDIRLNGVRRYPESARAHGDRGVTTLAFTVDRSGQVIGAHVMGSSGSLALDQESIAMAYRISPLLPPPSGRVSVIVRINFKAP